jgi:hypothetical protein
MILYQENVLLKTKNGTGYLVLGLPCFMAIKLPTGAPISLAITGHFIIKRKRISLGGAESVSKLPWPFDITRSDE